jgi:hypothetical protein
MAVFSRADQRRRHIDQMWAPDGHLAVSSLRLTTEELMTSTRTSAKFTTILIATKDSPSPATNTSSPATACCCLVDARAERRDLTELLKRLTPSPRRLAARVVGPELHLGH